MPMVKMTFVIVGPDNQRRGMYLQMSTDGRVSGSDVQTSASEYVCNGVNRLCSNITQMWHSFTVACLQVFWNWSQSELAMLLLGENHLLCFFAWTAEASWGDRYIYKRGLYFRNTHIYIRTFSRPSLFTRAFDFRVTSLMPTALSAKCCWQMDTLASCPRTTELLCLWHLNDPQTSTRSPSLASCRSGIHWQRRACLNRHQTGRDILTWTLMIFLEWA